MTIPAETPETTPRSWPTRLYLFLSVVIILVGLLLQARCLTFDKVIDDNDLIYSVEQRGCGANPADCFRHPVFLLYYRPLFTATFAVGDHLHNKDTVWYHVENMVFHTAACGLAFWFFFLLFQRERPALLAGLVFTLHPLQVTVTTFIGGRPDSMALIFLLLFVIGAWNCTQNPEVPTSITRRFAWFLVSLFGYACAVFTKEQCASMLLVLPLLLWRRGYVFPKRDLPWLVFYLLPVALYAYLAKKIMRMDTVPDPHWSIPLHVEMVGRTLTYFERLLLIPSVGPMHQSTLGPWDVPQYGVMITGYVLAILWLAAIWRFRRNEAFRLCSLWTTLTLLPCLNLIPIPSQFASVYRAAIPLLGFAGILGILLDRLFNGWPLRLPGSEVNPYSEAPTLAQERIMAPSPQFGLANAVVVILIGYYSYETLADVPYWRNNHTLMIAEVYGDPNFIPAYGGQGFYYETKKDWKQVEKEFSAVISAFMPDVPSERFVAAVDSPECQRALWSHAGLRYHPHGYKDAKGRFHADGYLCWILPHRGWARQEQGHFSLAAEDYRHALQLNPADDNSRANLHDCYMANGQVEEAMALYSNASEVEPLPHPDTNRATP